MEIDYETYYKRRRLTKEEFEIEINKLKIEETIAKIYSPEKLEEIQKKIKALEKVYSLYSENVHENVYEKVNRYFKNFGLNYQLNPNKVEYKHIREAGRREPDGTIVISYSHKDDVATHAHEAYHDYVAIGYDLYNDLKEFGIHGSASEAPAYLLELYIRLKEFERELSKKTPEEFGRCIQYLIKFLRYELIIKNYRNPTQKEILDYINRYRIKLLENEELLKKVLSSSIYDSWGFGRNSYIADILAEKIVEKFKKYLEETKNIEESIKRTINPQTLLKIIEELREKIKKRR